MTTKQLNDTTDILMESVDGYADLYTPGFGKTENHIRLLYALQARMCDELRLLERQIDRSEDAAETKDERHREERHLQQAA